MSKQYVDVSGWEDAAPQNQYVDVSGWEDAAPSAPADNRSLLRRVVDGVTAPFKAVAKAYAEDQAEQPTQPITAREKLALAQPLYEKGRRSEAYMAKLRRDAELEEGREKRAEQAKKREAQIEESKKPALQQLSDQFNPMRPVVAIPAAIGTLVGGEKTGKAIAKEFGGDVQYDTLQRDMTFSDANPEYVMAEQFIVDPSWGAKAGVGAAINRLNKIKSAPKLNQPAQEALAASETMLKDMGIDVPKTTTAKDDEIAIAINAEYGKGAGSDKSVVGSGEAKATQEPIVDESDTLKARMQAEQEARVAAAREEAMARKAELEENPHPQASTSPADSANDINVVTKAEEAAEEAPIPRFEALSAHPRYAELLEMRRNVSAKDAQNKAVRESDRTILHQNSGDGYETSVIPETDVRNYDYDFHLTKGDVAKIEAGKITPDIEEKLARDLERLDNDPLYAAIEEAKATPKADELQAKFASTFGNDAARYTMKLIDRFAKTQGVSVEEWIARSGIDFEDLTHTTYGQFKKDLAEADGLFQSKGGQSPELIVQHNLSEDNLLHAKKMGGIPVPSLAVVKHDQPLGGFGEITMIGPKELADPKGYAKTKVFGADIYSPRYPKVSYKFTPRDEKAIEKELSPFMEMAGRDGSYIEMDDLINNVGLKAKFLSERGIAPTIIKEGPGEKELKMLRHFDGVDMGRVPHDALQNSTYRSRVQQWLDDEAEGLWNTEMDADKFDRIATAMWRSMDATKDKLRRVDKVDFYATRNAIDEQVQGLRKEFAKYVDDFMRSHNVQEKIWNGTDYYGRHKYLTHTIENVVKKLKAELRGGESFNYGTGSLRAKYTPQFKSVKQIQEAKGKLVGKEDFEAVKKEVEEELFEIRNALKESYQYETNGFHYGEAVQAMLDDAASMGLSRALKEHGWKDVPEGVIRDVSSFMERLRNMPTEYFEAKVLREVSPAEFHVAVVPDNIGAEALQDLKDHGVHVRFYKAGDEADRARAIKEAALEHQEAVLFQDEVAVNGMVSLGFKSSGEMSSVIRAFQEADVSTLVHETAHVFERTLDDAQRAAYNRVFGHIDEGVARQEAFAEGFVKWLSEGKAPTAEMADVFAAFKTWLNELWQTLRGSKEAGFELREDMREFYRALMGDEEAAARLFKGELGAMDDAAREAEELFQKQPTHQSAGGFYSAAAKAIEKMPNKMDAEAFLKYLKNNGVKDDEITWSGIAKAVEGKGSVTKAEIQEAFGNPAMEKVVNGLIDDAMQMQADRDKLLDLAQKHMDFGPWEKDNPYTQPYREFENYINNKYGVDTATELDAMIKKQSGVKYQNYSLKGIGTNYREELTTLQDASNTEKWIADATGNKIAKANNMEDVYKELGAKTEEHKAKVDEMFDNGQLSFQDYTPPKNVQYKSSHWDEPNVLLHTRKQDTVIDGQKTLLVEEIQSDWHQAGRKGGYKQDTSPMEKELASLLQKDTLSLEEADRIDELRDAIFNASAGYPEAVSPAPYAKTWHELGMRQIIDEAVMSGYERVAWVTGKTSADRYSLSKSVDRLVYNKEVGVIQGYKDGESVLYKSATDDELEALIGKDPAKKLMDSEVNPGIYEIKGEQLDIGGDGMRGFYDKILVDYARKYVKKWGAEVEKKTLSDGTEVWSFPVTKQMREDVGQNGQALYAHGAGAVAGVGEDEDGNLTFDPTMALLGAAGVSMVASKTVRNAVSKVAARAEKLSDSAARNLVIATVKAADAVTAKSITKMADTIRKSDLADYVIGHKIYGLKDYMKLRESALRSANAGMEEAARLHLQLKELSSEAREAMYAYMTGEKNVALSPALKTAADTFVEKIDALGRTMVDEGFLSKEAYEEWKGQYLHRRYASKMKRASDWASGRGEFAVDKIQMRGKQWSADAQEYQELLDAGMIGKVSEGKVEVLSDMGDGTYKLRRDWTKEERASMGEIRDVAYALPETMGRLNQMIEFGAMLRSVSQKYILKQEGRSDKVMRQLGYTKLDGSRYGALNGKWVNASIASDLKRISNDVMGDESVTRLWSDYVSAMKMSHTIYNPTAHVNNIGSNIVMQAAAGLNPAKTLKYAADGARAARKVRRWKELDAQRAMGLSADEAAELSRLEGDADLTLWRDLSDKHMFGRSQLNEMLRTYMSPSIDTTSGSALRKISETAKAIYQGEDDVMRFAAVKQLMDDGLWTQTAEGMRQVRMSLDEAISKVNDDIVPDYTKPMSRLALTLRDTGVVPFMSWTYYSTPILFKQLRDHPTRVMAVIGSWYAVDRIMGVDPFDEESVPKGWAEQRIAVGRDGDKVTGLRVSSMVPHIQLATPANTFLEPLTSGIPQTLLGQATNYNFYFRKPITQKEGPEGAYQWTKSAVQNALPTPDGLDKLYNIAESRLMDKETRRRDRVFEPRTPAQEAASLFLNLQTYDESNQRASYRKDRVKERRNETTLERKVDRAMTKMKRVFQ